MPADRDINAAVTGKNTALRSDRVVVAVHFVISGTDAARTGHGAE